MSKNQYTFVTHWYIDGTVEEVATIITDSDSLTQWWPSVYLAVREVEAGDANGIGKKIELHTKGWLPYTLRWHFVVTKVEVNKRIVLQAEGDFVGHGIWTFSQEGERAHIRYDWSITAEKPILRLFSPILRPIFSANHEWAMRMGETSLRLEAARRRASTAEERARIPTPPSRT